MKATPDSLVETLAAQWDGCEYDAPGGLIDIGDAIRRAGLPLAAILRAEVERLAAQSAPLAQQAREYPPLPKLPTMTVLSELQSGTQEMVRLDVAHEAMRAYVDADRAAAQVEPPSMPSSEWLAEAERIAGEFTVAVANGESAAAALAYSNLRAHLSKRITADEVRMLTVTEFNVGRFCLGEDECIAQGIDFSAYERGIADASAAFSRNT